MLNSEKAFEEARFALKLAQAKVTQSENPDAPKSAAERDEARAAEAEAKTAYVEAKRAFEAERVRTPEEVERAKVKAERISARVAREAETRAKSEAMVPDVLQLVLRNVEAAKLSRERGEDGSDPFTTHCESAMTECLAACSCSEDTEALLQAFMSVGRVVRGLQRAAGKVDSQLRRAEAHDLSDDEILAQADRIQARRVESSAEVKPL